MLRIATLGAVLLAAAAASSETVTIATWNLGGFHQIPQSNLERIIEGMRILDADVYVLPELNPISHADAIAAALSQAPGPCYESSAPDQPKARQQIGFVFRCDIQVTDVGLFAGSNLGKQGYRNAALAHVTAGQFDFWLVGLHLKAGRGATNRSLRDQQLRAISGFVQGVLRGPEKDVLVIGDYNMIPGEDERNFETLNADGSIHVASMDLPPSHLSSSGTGAGSLLDGYAFTNVDDSEFVDGSIAVMDMPADLGLTPAQYRATVTDHLPVMAEFEVDQDHD